MIGMGHKFILICTVKAIDSVPESGYPRRHRHRFFNETHFNIILHIFVGRTVQVVLYRMFTLCANLRTGWLNSSEILSCVFVWVVTEISKKKMTPSLARFKQSKETWLPESWSWRQKHLSKRREPLAQRHGVTSQKTWNLSNNTVKTSHLTFPCAMWKFLGEKVKQYSRIPILDKVTGSDSCFG